MLNVCDQAPRWPKLQLILVTNIDILLIYGIYQWSKASHIKITLFLADNFLRLILKVLIKMFDNSK